MRVSFDLRKTRIENVFLFIWDLVQAAASLNIFFTENIGADEEHKRNEYIEKFIRDLYGGERAEEN